jgi:hypothetical protein
MYKAYIEQKVQVQKGKERHKNRVLGVKKIIAAKIISTKNVKKRHLYPSNCTCTHVTRKSKGQKQICL